MRMTISPPRVASHPERLIKVKQSFRSHGGLLQTARNVLIAQDVNVASYGHADV